jgi:hypothetical protein
LKLSFECRHYQAELGSEEKDLKNAKQYYKGLKIVVNEDHITGNPTTPNLADKHPVSLARDWYHNQNTSNREMAINLFKEVVCVTGVTFLRHSGDSRNPEIGVIVTHRHCGLERSRE